MEKLFDFLAVLVWVFPLQNGEPIKGRDMYKLLLGLPTR